MERIHICGGCGSREDVGYLVDATIAALQARVKELEEWVQDQSTANLETMRHMDEMQSRAMDAESQLTQRTSELEAARRCKADEHDLWLQACKERVNLQAKLERVRVLVKALPKVEGEITVSADPNGWYVMPLLIRCVTKEQADGIAALLKHRQGMEG